MRLVLTRLNGGARRSASGRNGPGGLSWCSGVLLSSTVLQRNAKGRKAGRKFFHALGDRLADLVLLVGHLGGRRRGGGRRLGGHVEGRARVLERLDTTGTRRHRLEKLLALLLRLLCLLREDAARSVVDDVGAAALYARDSNHDRCTSAERNAAQDLCRSHSGLWIRQVHNRLVREMVKVQEIDQVPDANSAKLDVHHRLREPRRNWRQREGR